MAEVIWTGPALADLHDIIDYISKDSPVYAERFADALLEAPNRLGRFPLSGSVVPEFQQENIRELFHGAYRLIYLAREDACYITAIIHGARDILRKIDPDSWDVE